MKKIIALMTAIVLASTLTACGKSEAEKKAEAVKKKYDAPLVRGLGY